MPTRITRKHKSFNLGGSECALRYTNNRPVSQHFCLGKVKVCLDEKVVRPYRRILFWEQRNHRMNPANPGCRFVPLSFASFHIHQLIRLSNYAVVGFGRAWFDSAHFMGSKHCPNDCNPSGDYCLTCHVPIVCGLHEFETSTVVHRFPAPT